MPKIRSILLFISACLLFCTACEDNNYFTVGNGNVNTNTRVVVIDTCTLNISTVIGDSIYTSGRNIAWVGKYNDSETGKTEASTYLGVDFPTAYQVDEKAIFDSIVITLTPNGNYYGDTVAFQDIEVYQLAEEIIYDDNDKLYNTSSIPTESSPIGRLSFRSRPRGQLPVEARLDDDFGRNLLALFSSGAPEVENGSKFQKYFKGLAFKPGSDSKALMSYNLADTNFRMTIHYHVITDHKDERVLAFQATSTSHFYNLQTDRTGTPLEGYTSRDLDISSYLTGQQSYVQAGTLMQTRIEFPYLNNILALGKYGRIERAMLYIRPVRTTYGDDMDVPLPTELNLYVNNSLGTATDIIQDDSGTTQGGTLVVDYVHKQETYYSFNITRFLQSQLGAEGTTKSSLLLSIPSSKLYTTVDRLVVGDATNKDHSRIELKLFYSVYTGDN